MWRTLRRILDVLGEGLRRVKGRSEAVLPKDRPQGIFSDRSVLRWDFKNVCPVSVTVFSTDCLLTEKWIYFRVLQSTAELLGLFGHEAERRRALALLCEVATRIGDSEFLRLAAGDLIKARYSDDIRKLRQPPSMNF